MAKAFLKRLPQITGYLLIFLLVSPGVSQAFLFKKSSYQRVLKKWSRERIEYQRPDFYASVSWQAVLQNRPFLVAKTEKMGEIYQWSAEEKNERLQAEFQKHYNGTVSFFISVYTYERRFADIADSSNGWRVTLKANGKDLKPLRFEILDKPKPLERTLYPSIEVWTKNYFVYFPKPKTLRGPLKLTLRGPAGNSELKWSTYE